jgi:hypothetical protein
MYLLIALVTCAMFGILQIIVNVMLPIKDTYGTRNISIFSTLVSAN